MIAGGLPKEALILRLTEAGIQFNKYALDLFEHRDFLPDRKNKSVQLAKVNLAALNLSGPCSYQTVIERASKLGLKLCPLDLAAFLRLEYLDQPAGPYLTIASPKPEEDENFPTGFYIRNSENSLWLRGYRASGDVEWPPQNEFIFLK